ncbi:B-cell linker protein [Nymphon striatum]|nr:B-cell linker protein [Nymphon striatum]
MLPISKRNSFNTCVFWCFLVQIMKYVREYKNQGFTSDKGSRKDTFYIGVRLQTQEYIYQTTIPDFLIFFSKKNVFLFTSTLTMRQIDLHQNSTQPTPVVISVVTNYEYLGGVLYTGPSLTSYPRDRVLSLLSQPASDIKEESMIIHNVKDNTNENTKPNIPKPPKSKPPISNYPKFTPLKFQQINNKCVKRPQTIPPPPPPLEYFEENYEIPNSSCDTGTNSSSSSLIATIVESLVNSSPSNLDIYESLDLIFRAVPENVHVGGGAEGTLFRPQQPMSGKVEVKLKEQQQVQRVILIQHFYISVPPEAVPCTRSPSSRKQSSNSPSLPPRLTRGSPASYSPPPLPKKQENPPSPPPPAEAKPRDIKLATSEKHNLMNRPLPLPPAQEIDVKEKEVEARKYSDEQDAFKKYDWYHSVEREEAEFKVKRNGTSGTYLIRESRRGGISNPHTLTIFYNDKVYHLNIRKRPDQMYALGSAKSNELTFVSLAELVKIHQADPILLSSKGATVGQTCLIQTPPKGILCNYKFWLPNLPVISKKVWRHMVLAYFIHKVSYNVNRRQALLERLKLTKWSTHLPGSPHCLFTLIDDSGSWSLVLHKVPSMHFSITKFQINTRSRSMEI